MNRVNELTVRDWDKWLKILAARTRTAVNAPANLFWEWANGAAGRFGVD